MPELGSYAFEIAGISRRLKKRIALQIIAVTVSVYFSSVFPRVRILGKHLRPQSLVAHPALSAP
jgi:hypothetical protein